MQTIKPPRDMWAVLAASVSETEARAKYRVLTGREPDRIHWDLDRGWWFMGWIDWAEASAWRGHDTTAVRNG